MESIANLAVLRKEIEEVKAVMKSELENFQASLFWQDLQIRRAGIEEAIIFAEARVRMDAITAYNADGIKKGKGVSIKMKTTAEIVDENATRAWCIGNFTPALKLDTKMIEKAAKDGTIPAELVKITTEPSAYIDSDLSGYLPKE
jgi:hypothetical protein